MRKFEALVFLGVWACTALACLISPRLAEVEAATLPAGFTESTVFSGLTEPTAVRFSPDGRVFVTEKSGLVKVFTDLSATTPTVFHDLRTNVHNFWDRGLMGLALHPNFPTLPYVYVLYTYDKDPTNNNPAPRWGTPGATSDGCPTPPGPTTNGCVVSGRLSQLTASGNVSTGTESVLVEGWGQQFPSHSMDTVMFSPLYPTDGALYASAGEGASFTFTDYGQAGSPLNPLGDPPVGIGGVQTSPTAEGGRTRSQSLRRVSGPAVLNGTIIRVDPFTGAALSDNPLFANADLNARRIVAYGLRNPFRFTFRPGTNEVWVGDVGDNTAEEIDRISNPLSPTVKNFGWPCYEGPAPHAGFQALALNICETLYTSGSAVPPYYHYNHTDQVVAGETCPTGSSSISGIAFYQGGSYPASYQGALFFADHSRNCIWSMFAGANGLPDPATRATFVAGAARPVDLQIGPGGDLFYVDFDGGTIRRIQFTSGNLAPIAVIQATPLSGPAPLTVAFDGRASSDPNAGDTLTYSWDLNGDGLFGDALTAQTSFTYTQANLYNVKLKVTDNHGASNIASVSIQAGNPTAVIDTPAATLHWQVGQSITFSGHATDPGQITLPPSAFSWDIILHHCPSNCHTHPVQSFSGVTTASFAAPDHSYYSYLEIKLTVTDARGLTDTKSVFLDPQTVDLNFASTPSGLQLVVGSDSSPTPFTRTVILGSANSVSAVTPQTVGGTPLYFISWSDGGNQSHQVTGAFPATYTATYSPTADMMPPTAPSSLSANPISGGQITLSWPASTDNVGVTGYQVERCQGVGCTTFALIASPMTASYVDTGLSPGTSYSYRIRAQDAVGNFSPYSPITTTVGSASAITFDAASSSAAGNTTNSISWTHTVGSGTNRVLAVCTQARDTVAGNVIVSSVTSNGQALSAVPAALQNTGTSWLRTQLWYLPNPSTGPNTITITWGGALYYGVGSATSYAGVNPSAPIDAHAEAGGTGTTPAVNITTTAADALITDCVLGQGNPLIAVGAGQTLRVNRDTTGTVDSTGVSTVNDKTTAGTVTMNWTQSSAQSWAISAVSLRPATSTPPPVTAITYDATSSSAAGNTTNSISWIHTVGNGSNRFFAVCTQARDTVASDVAVTAVTANGFPLTKVRADLRTNGGSSFGTELWYLPNPGIGAYTITVTWAGALSNYGVGSAASYFGVNQGAPIDAHAGSGGTGTTLSTAITTGVNHALITDCAIGQANTTTEALTVGAGQTTRVNRLTTGTVDSVGVSTVDDKAVAGSETMDWTQVAAQNWVISAVSLRPATSTPPPVTAITYDATSSSAAGNTTNSISWTHTVGTGTNRLLAVCTQARDTMAGNVIVSSVTSNGQALSAVPAALLNAGSSWLGTQLWYLPNPSTGPNTITITWGGALYYGVGSATSYAGVAPSAPIDAHAEAVGNGATPSVNITTTTTHALITDCVLGQGNPLIGVGAGQTLRVNRDTTGTVDSTGVSTVNDKTPAGAVTMNWTQSVASNWAISAVSLRPAP